MIILKTICLFTAALGLCCCAPSFSSCSYWSLLFGVWASHHSGFSCGAWALDLRLQQFSKQAQLLHGMWNFPGPRIEPMSPALAGKILIHCTTMEIPNGVFFLFFKSNKDAKASSDCGKTRQKRTFLVEKVDVHDNNETLSKDERSLRLPLPSDDHNERRGI